MFDMSGRCKAAEPARGSLPYGSQYLMIKGVERVRTFDMERVPERQKMGRPRADADAHNETVDAKTEQPIAGANASGDISW